jgi:hypothetical protein
MTKEEIQRRLEAAEKQNLGLLDEIQNLKAKLAEMQDEPEIPDFPNFKCGESYWTMFDNFALSDERTAFVRDATECNMFHTEAYAQEFANKCKLIAMMLHCKWYLCCDHHSDFNDFDILKYAVVFDFNEEKFVIEYSRTREWSTIYFDTIENAQKCADWLNKHWSDCDD